MSKYAFTLHRVIRGKKDTEPRSIIELGDDEFAELEAVGAVREATEAEIELHELVQSKKDKSAAKKKPAATKASEERKVLEEQAAELGVNFRKNTPDAKLIADIEEAKKAAEDAAKSSPTDENLLGD
jgi:hypothetical protein